MRAGRGAVGCWGTSRRLCRAVRGAAGWAARPAAAAGERHAWNWRRGSKRASCVAVLGVGHGNKLLSHLYDCHLSKVGAAQCHGHPGMGSESQCRPGGVPEPWDAALREVLVGWADGWL